MHGQIIGMDEAGYGPNLGPLVITVTVWDVPDTPQECDLWSLLSDAVRNEPAEDGRLHIADSKQVYQPNRGIAELERSVLSCFRSMDNHSTSLDQLISSLATADSLSSLWYHERPVQVPQVVDAQATETGARQFGDSLMSAGIRLKEIRSEIIEETRYNSLLSECDGKGALLTAQSLSLLRSVWDPKSEIPTLIISDKHGGRGRYGAALSDAFEGVLPSILEEGRAISRYRINTAELRFQTKGEAHLPVALASMVSKYVRELAMHALNGFWASRVSNLRPTKGYPVDARRFRNDVESARQKEQISLFDFWRQK